MVSDGTEFAVGCIEKLFDEARRNTKAKHKKWAKYSDRRRRDVQIKVKGWVLVKTHPLSSAAQKVVAKFKPKFEGPYMILEYSRKNGLGERRELKGKGTSLKKDQGERHTSITSNRRPLVRSSRGSWIEPNRRTKKCRKETLGLKRSLQIGSGLPERKYRKGPRQQVAKRKFLPRRGAKVESRPANEKRTQQGGQIRSSGRNNSTDPTPRSKEGQTARMPEAEVVNNSIASRGKEERTATDPYLRRS
ncbi:uncharacterized protein TNCV_2812481 [Trichonephila clavipes]|nr:uncharacterized protein TNCV_2812481 [Trichonephila clavipes]